MSEHSEQSLVIQWAKVHEGQYPELEMLFAVPNAGKRSIGAARYYLDEGMRAGIPDILLPISHETQTGYIYIGLAIEMKFGKNKITEAQEWWLKHLAQYGWKTAVCYSANETINVISNYLEIAT